MTEDLFLIKNKLYDQSQFGDGLKNCHSTSMYNLNEENPENGKNSEEKQHQQSRLNSASLYSDKLYFSGDDDSSSIFYENNSKNTSDVNHDDKRNTSSNYDYNSRKELLMQSITTSNISVSNCFSTNSENNQNFNTTDIRNEILFKDQATTIFIDFDENNLATTYRGGSTLNNQIGNNINNQNNNEDRSSEHSDKNKKIIVRVVTVVSAVFFIICFAMVAFTLRMSEKIDEESKSCFDLNLFT
jgi:hypothetical protein